jgi:formylglycine-generating enzyme required for sulfatase activity
MCQNLPQKVGAGEVAMRVAAAVASAVLLLCLGVLPSYAEKRVALVVGNDRYPNLAADQQLQKAVNDSRAVGAALARIGFEVINGENLNRQALVDKFDEMTRKLSPGDTAFFFFAGHGVTISGGNYILPIDVPNVEAGQETRLARVALGESDIISDLQQRGVRVAVVVLDACRDNPYRRPGVRSVGGERGLARIEPARGIFTLYSAGIGQTALDRLGAADTNPNSVFTRVLVPRLAQPGLDLAELAIGVREEVAQLAGTVGHDQRPAYYDETIGGRIYLAGLPGSEPARPAQVSPPDQAAQAWAVIQNTSGPAVLEDFIRQFGDTPYGSMARARLDELKRGQVAVVAPPSRPPVSADPCGSGAMTASLSARAAAPLCVAEERSLKPKDTFRECEQCPDMVVAPAGSFTMGSPASEPFRQPHEGPQHRVTFSRQFAAGKFAVTVDQFAAFVQETGYDTGSKCYTYDGGNWGIRSGRSWRNPGFVQSGSHPVVCISWDDAKAYVTWVSRKTGKTYRLLSEAEREYVARAGTTTTFWWGSTISTSQANYNGVRKQTMPVESFQPNPWGLYQVHGNVWEWVEDCYKDSYVGAPTDGSVSTAFDCSQRVHRGGSWYNHPRYLRSADRYWRTTNYRDYLLGFRVARTLLAP